MKNWYKIGQLLKNEMKKKLGFSNGGPYRTRICDLYHVKKAIQSKLLLFKSLNSLYKLNTYVISRVKKQKHDQILITTDYGHLRNANLKHWSKIGQRYGQLRLRIHIQGY